MPLLSQSLSVWEISHRWAGFDPDGLRWWLPLAVRDNARILFDAIYHSEIESHSLSMNKWSPDDGDEAKPFFIRYHLEDIFDLIAGKKYKRSLIKWATIERHELYDWCKRHAIPLPEFWFPAGWGLHYDWKAGEADADADAPPLDECPEGSKPLPEVRAPARSRIAAQEMAEALWAEVPNMTIADMIRHPDLVKYAKASHYQPDTVRRWLSEVAPAAVRNKRGRPSKKSHPE